MFVFPVPLYVPRLEDEGIPKGDGERVLEDCDSILFCRTPPLSELQKI
jgi:hypothetical protein